MTATELLLHDINCTDVDNGEAMKAARQSVDLIRCLPQTVSPQLLPLHMYNIIWLADLFAIKVVSSLRWGDNGSMVHYCKVYDQGVGPFKAKRR